MIHRPPSCSCCGGVPGWIKALFLTTMLGALFGALSPLAAQQPDTARADTVRADTVRADTLPADTLAADTVPMTPERRALERLRELRPATGGLVRPEDTIPRPDTTAAGQRAGERGGRQRQRAPSGIATDSIMRELLQLEGYEALTYAAESVRFSQDTQRVRLYGPAEIERLGQGMRADSLLDYDLAREVVCGYGQPVLTGEDMAPLRARQLCYDVERRVGEIAGGETTFTQGAEWRVMGDLYPVGQSRVFVKRAQFTSCDLEVPHYHFAAREVKMVRDSVMVARDITLNFGDVPVFWMPFMVQSLKRGRRSGLLTPEFSLNQVVRTSDRLNRSIENLGYYWAINEHLGATMAFGWFANNWTQLQGEFEYLFVRQFLRGTVNVRRYWRDGGSRELTLSTRNSWQPDERTRLGVNGSYASSSDFVARNTFDPRELNRELQSNASMSRRFDWGSADLTANRRQSLSDNKVTTTLPQLGLTISPITLFEAPPSQASFYNNATWNASGGFQETRTDIDEALTRSEQDQAQRRANLSSAFRMGNLSWSQSFDLDRGETTRRELPPLGEEEPADTLEGALREQLTWRTGLDYQMRLIGTSTFTPNVTLRGEQLRSDETEHEFVAAPTRLDFGARLQTDIYGFFPGVGPVERVRHRMSPSINYTYSPKPTDITQAQRDAFGENFADAIQEQNRISIGLSQTIEAKWPEEEEADTAAAEAEEAAEEEREEDEGPRRLPQARKITLLSLQTEAIAYDFVRAREEGHGITNNEIRNSLSSDLLRGFRFSLTHDLFEEGERPEDGGVVPRSFQPHLNRVNASFSFGSDSWLFRALRLGPRATGTAEGDPELTPGQRREPDEPEGELGAEPEREIEELARGESGLGLIGGRGEVTSPAGGGAVGTWNASLDYSWTRPRPDTLTSLRRQEENQMLQGTLSFQPTRYWSVNWRTGYSLTEGEFEDHVVTLSRDLHRWQANFDFVKVQNGNFTFQFRVSLRDNPDLKVDYEQRSDPAAGRRRDERF